ncbi:hypothetical protein Ancab_002105 [Ancistrocladus abbreviatus]
MDPCPTAAIVDVAGPSKKRKAPKSSVKSSAASMNQPLLIIPFDRSQVQTPSERENRKFESSSLIIDANHILKFSLIRCLGYKPPASVPTLRYYEINLKTFGSALFGLFSAYLRIKLYEQKVLTYDRADVETPSYSKDVELPHPFANAIQTFVAFAPRNIANNYSGSMPITSPVEALSEKENVNGLATTSEATGLGVQAAGFLALESRDNLFLNHLVLHLLPVFAGTIVCFGTHILFSLDSQACGSFIQLFNLFD